VTSKPAASTREEGRLRVPIGVEQVLCRAASDARFRRALLADREKALADAGIALGPSEQAVLRTVPGGLLDAMIRRIDPESHGSGALFRTVAAAAFSAAALSAAPGCSRESVPPPPAPVEGARVEVTSPQGVPSPTDTGRPHADVPRPGPMTKGATLQLPPEATVPSSSVATRGIRPKGQMAEFLRTFVQKSQQPAGRVREAILRSHQQGAISDTERDELLDLLEKRLER
jgi:hypothetical protein